MVQQKTKISNKKDDRLFIYHIFMNHDPKRSKELGFCSTISKLMDRLDYIQDMGFNTIMSNPLFKCKSYHGYDIDDFFSIDPNVGTMEEFEGLLKELDKRGMKYIFDITLAHTSDTHPWFKEFIQGKNDYYVFKDKVDNDLSTDMHDTTHFWRYDYQKYVLGAFGGHMPSLNVESESLRNEIKKILQFWVKKSNNMGFRLDAIFHNNVTEKNHDGIPYCKFIRECVDEINPDCILIGEVWKNKTMLEEPIEYSKVLGNIIDFYNSFGIINQVNAGVKDIKIEKDKYKRSTLFSCNHDTTRLYSLLGKDINKVKRVLKTMILDTDMDISIYYGTEGNWYGDVVNGHDLPVRSYMSDEHIQGLLEGKYNSLVPYIRELIQKSKEK